MSNMSSIKFEILKEQIFEGFNLMHEDLMGLISSMKI